MPNLNSHETPGELIPLPAGYEHVGYITSDYAPIEGVIICAKPRPGHPREFCVRPIGHEGRHWNGKENHPMFRRPGSPPEAFVRAADAQGFKVVD